MRDEFTRRPSIWRERGARRQAAAGLAEEGRPERQGYRTRHLVDADAHLGLRGGADPFPRLIRLESRIDELARVSVRRRELAERLAVGERPGGSGPMAPPLWLLAVILVFAIDLALGRYLMAKAAPDDGDALVTLSAAGIAMWVFTTSHVLGRVIADRARERVPVVAVFTLAYAAFVVWVLAVADAAAGRWAISFVPLVAGSLVQSQRPDPDFWARSIVRFQRAALGPLARRRARRCARAAADFTVSLVAARRHWLARSAVGASVEGEWGLAAETPSAERTEADLHRLERTGLVPPQAVIDAVMARLTLARDGDGAVPSPPPTAARGSDRPRTVTHLSTVESRRN